MLVREMARSMAFLPRSMRLAISTSPSRVRRGTVPISRRYMRTGSFVLSSAPGVRSSSTPSSSDFSRNFCSESTTSMPMEPNMEKMSSSSSDEPMSDGSRSFTSS